MIVILHILGQGGVLANSSFLSGQYTVAWLLEILCYCSVDCFALISGYVGIGATFKWSKLINLWIHVVLYSLTITAIYWLFSPGRIHLNSIANACFPITRSCYWYITAYFGMYPFIPLINSAIKKIDKRYLVILCAFILLCMSILPCVTLSSPYQLSAGYSIVWLTILYFLGGCIKHFDLFNKLNNSKLIGGGIIVASVLILFLSKISIIIATSHLLDSPKDGMPFICYTSPFVLLNAILLLYIFSKIKIQSLIINKLVLFLTPMVLGVYIIHCNPLVFGTLGGKTAWISERSATMLPIYVLLIAVGIYLICSIIDYFRIRLFKFIKVPAVCSYLEDKLLAMAGKMINRINL